MEFVDEQTKSGAYPSRSAAVQAAIGLLRDRQYTDSYAAAWDEWDRSDDSVLWEAAAGDVVR